MCCEFRLVKAHSDCQPPGSVGCSKGLKLFLLWGSVLHESYPIPSSTKTDYLFGTILPFPIIAGFVAPHFIPTKAVWFAFEVPVAARSWGVAPRRRRRFHFRGNGALSNCKDTPHLSLFLSFSQPGSEPATLRSLDVRTCFNARPLYGRFGSG